MGTQLNGRASVLQTDGWRFKSFCTQKKEECIAQRQSGGFQNRRYGFESFCACICEYSSMVEWLPSKQFVRVRVSLPAFFFFFSKIGMEWMPQHQHRGRENTKGCFVLFRKTDFLQETKKLKKTEIGNLLYQEKNQQGNRKQWRTKLVYLYFFFLETPLCVLFLAIEFFFWKKKPERVIVPYRKS